MTEPHINDNKTQIPAVAERVLLIFSMIGTVSALAWVLWFSRYGLDFTDESFYLVWIASPFNYGESTTQFGFVYHPMYELLGGNIARLRQANTLVTFGLAWVLSYAFLTSVFATQPLARPHRLIISAAFATTSLLSLLFLTTWLPTPSYNSLALQALLIAATGLLLAGKNVSRNSITGWILIGAGGWLTFMAKPSSAAALGLGSVVYLLLAGKFSFRLLLASAATALALLGLSALAIDGSVAGFIARLSGGVKVAEALGGGHTIMQLLRLDDFQLSAKTELLLLAGTATFYAAAYLSQAPTSSQVRAGTWMSVLLAISGIAIVFGLPIKPLRAGHFQALLIWTIPLTTALLGLAIYRPRGLRQITRRQWVLAVFFLTFPHIYAFGTNGNYWNSGASAGIFWCLGALVLLSPVSSTQKLTAMLLPLGLAAQLVTVALIHSGIQSPYRQPAPLLDNGYTLDFGRSGSTLVLSRDFGQYIADATEAAKKAEFKAGTPMIDLTGQSPGVLYAMGANNVGQAWMIGGYPGSQALAVASLDKVSCEQLAHAWLLAEPDGPRSISPDVLLSYGARLATDFELVGSVVTARGAGGYKEARAQQIYKPLRPNDIGIAACTEHRLEMR